MIEPEFKPGTLVSRTCALSTGQCSPNSFLPNPRAYDILDSDLYWGSFSQPAATFWEVAGWGLFIQELKELFCYAKVSDGKCVRVPLCAFEDVSVQNPEFWCLGTRKDMFNRQGQEQVWGVAEEEALTTQTPHLPGWAKPGGGALRASPLYRWGD